MVSARFLSIPDELWEIVRCVQPVGRKGTGVAAYLVSLVERVGYGNLLGGWIGREVFLVVFVLALLALVDLVGFDAAVVSALFFLPLDSSTIDPDRDLPLFFVASLLFSITDTFPPPRDKSSPSLTTTNSKTSLRHIRPYNIPKVGSPTPFKLAITSPFLNASCIPHPPGGQRTTNLSFTNCNGTSPLACFKTDVFGTRL